MLKRTILTNSYFYFVLSVKKKSWIKKSLIIEESISDIDLYNSTKDFLGISFLVETSSTSSIIKLN
jgi:hypothetical protein